MARPLVCTNVRLPFSTGGGRRGLKPRGKSVVQSSTRRLCEACALCMLWPLFMYVKLRLTLSFHRLLCSLRLACFVPFFVDSQAYEQTRDDKTKPYPLREIIEVAQSIQDDCRDRPVKPVLSSGKPARPVFILSYQLYPEGYRPEFVDF